MNRVIILLLILIIGLSLLSVVLGMGKQENFAVQEGGITFFDPKNSEDVFKWTDGNGVSYDVRLDYDIPNKQTTVNVMKDGNMLLPSFGYVESVVLMDKNRLFVLGDDNLEEIVVENGGVVKKPINDEKLIQQYFGAIIMWVMKQPQNELQPLQPQNELQPLQQQNELQPLQPSNGLQPRPIVDENTFNGEPVPASSCDDKLFRIEEILNEPFSNGWN